MDLASPRPSWIATLGALWFVLNVYVWLVPKYRRLLIERRGPLLGAGFAFGAALISAVIDAFSVGLGAAAALFAVRFLFLLIPFLIPLATKLPRAPHPLDLCVFLYALLLPRFPGFGGVWLTLGGAMPAHAGFFATLGPGTLGAGALIVTYFFGVRWWSEVVVEWRLRPADHAPALRATALALLGAMVFGLIAEGSLRSFSGVGKSVLFGPGAAASLLAMIAIVPVEEVFFRGILLAGLRRAPALRGSKRLRPVIEPVMAIAVAALHAWWGAYALPAPAAFGLSLGIGLAALGTNRLLPSVLGHGAALLLAGGIGWLLPN